MDLYLMRHGIAHELGEQGVQRDSERPLTGEGRERVQAIARRLVVLKVKPDLIATSTFVRARETAEIVAHTLGRHVPLEEWDFLEPGADAQNLMAGLKQTSAAAVLVVGHMPDLTEIASEFLCGHPQAGIVFRKAAVACLAFEHTPAIGKANLEWLMQPRQLLAADD